MAALVIVGTGRLAKQAGADGSLLANVCSVAALLAALVALRSRMSRPRPRSPLPSPPSSGRRISSRSTSGAVCTTSPSFDRLAVDAAGCPPEWGTGALAYEAGKLVSVSVSNEPVRKIVFKCRNWPNTGYCNQAGFKPVESQYAGMAWTLVGACEGTMAPTLSPVPYAGTCQYDRCRDVESTCTPGLVGCSCLAGQAASSSCKKTERVCTPTDGDTWASGLLCMEGDVVHVGLDRFTCRPWPNFLWCDNEVYRPTDKAGILQDAWTKGGVCS